MKKSTFTGVCFQLRRQRHVLHLRVTFWVAFGWEESGRPLVWAGDLVPFLLSLFCIGSSGVPGGGVVWFGCDGDGVGLLWGVGDGGN